MSATDHIWAGQEAEKLGVEAGLGKSRPTFHFFRRVPVSQNSNAGRDQVFKHKSLGGGTFIYD